MGAFNAGKAIRKLVDGRGDASWDVVHHNYLGRDPHTRAVADKVLAQPMLSKKLRERLKTSAQAAYAIGRKNASIQLLSVLYNVRYLEGAKEEIGDYAMLRRLMKEAVPPFPATVREFVKPG